MPSTPSIPHPDIFDDSVRALVRNDGKPYVPPIYTEPRGYRPYKRPRTSNLPIRSIAPASGEPASNVTKPETSILLKMPERLNDEEFLTGVEGPMKGILLGIVPEELARWDPRLHNNLMCVNSILSGKENLMPDDPRDEDFVNSVISFVRERHNEALGFPIRNISYARNTIINGVKEAGGRNPDVQFEEPNLDNPELTRSIVEYYAQKSERVLEILS